MTGLRATTFLLASLVGLGLLAPVSALAQDSMSPSDVLLKLPRDLSP